MWDASDTVTGSEWQRGGDALTGRRGRRPLRKDTDCRGGDGGAMWASPPYGETDSHASDTVTGSE